MLIAELDAWETLWLRQQPGASRGQRRRAGPEEGEEPSPAHPGRRGFDGHVAFLALDAPYARSIYHSSFLRPPSPALRLAKWGYCYPTAASYSAGGLDFLRVLQSTKRADERTRTADLLINELATWSFYTFPAV